MITDKQNSSRVQYPGIKKLFFVEAEKLQPDIEKSAMAGLPVAVFTELSQICFHGEADLTVETSWVNGEYSQKSSLEFNAATEIPIEKKLAFVAVTASDEAYLIGNREGKAPEFDLSRTSGSTSKAAALKVKVTHIAVRSAIKCTY